jgi:hypothetical protein
MAANLPPSVTGRAAAVQLALRLQEVQGGARAAQERGVARDAAIVELGPERASEVGLPTSLRSSSPIDRATSRNERRAGKPEAN